MRQILYAAVTALAFLVSNTCLGQIIQRPLTIPVCCNKTTLLLFPAPIAEGDRGSADIITQLGKKTLNVLKVKAAKADFKPTNLSVITADGKIYSIDIRFDSDPSRLAYDLSDSVSSEPLSAVFKEDRMNDPSIEKTAKNCLTFKPFLKRPAFKNYHVRANLAGIYIKNGVLFFRFRIRNLSKIPYRVNFFRFYEKDKTASRKTSVMELEKTPLYLASDGNKIGAMSSFSLVAAFDQFTIAENKNFCFELFEKNGDRHLLLNIKGKDIFKARPL